MIHGYVLLLETLLELLAIDRCVFLVLAQLAQPLLLVQLHLHLHVVIIDPRGLRLAVVLFLLLLAALVLASCRLLGGLKHLGGQLRFI